MCGPTPAYRRWATELPAAASRALLMPGMRRWAPAPALEPRARDSRDAAAGCGAFTDADPRRRDARLFSPVARSRAAAGEAMYRRRVLIVGGGIAGLALVPISRAPASRSR
jgi:hypothetical protein